MDEATEPSLALRLMEKGVPKSHAYALAGGKPSIPVAVRIWRRTGIKIGPLADASDDEVEVIDAAQSRAEAAA
jgi:hypothetical protein